MPAPRTLSVTAGILYLVTFITFIPALALKTPFLDGAAGATSAQAAVLLEIVLAVACVGTAVVIYPLVRTLAPVLALGFVTSRVLEAAAILTGVLSLLALVTVRADHALGTPTDDALVALHD